MSHAKDPRTAERRPPFEEARPQPHPGRDSTLRPQADHGDPTKPGFGRLKDRVVLITGGDSGIGRAVAIASAREGADVVIGYLREHDDASETVRLVRKAGRAALAIAGDLIDEATCRTLVEKTIERFGRLDVLVLNAAYQGPAVDRFEQLDHARVEATLRTNLLAAFDLVRFALPHLKAGASIINLASIQASEPSPGILDYATTKGALVTFTKGLAESLAPRGIRVNAVAPGPVWTPLVVQSFDEEKLRKFGSNTPLGRAAQPVELAPAFVFLASDDASYVTGETVKVTGGR